MSVDSAFHDTRRIVIVVCPECKRSFLERNAPKPCTACGEQAAGELADKTEQS